jgi:hypothetical protein
MPKSRAQFTPMRTSAAISRTKIIITLDTICRLDPLFDKQRVLGGFRVPIERSMVLSPGSSDNDAIFF